MRLSAFIVAITLFLCGNGPAQAAPLANPSKATQPAPAMRGIRPVPVSLIEVPAANRGEVAVCANLAAVRALNAKAVGAGYDAQARVANVAFLLCMTGTPIEG